jgi:arylsulfatase A-like enzyme
LRVTLITRGPGVAANAVVEEPVSTIDLCPTLFDYADCKPALTPHGQSLRKLMEGQPEERECARSEWELLPTRAGVALSLRVVRTKTHKLTLDRISGDGELYDLVQDPHELNNRFNDPAYASVQKGLKAMLDARPYDQQALRTQVGLA